MYLISDLETQNTVVRKRMGNPWHPDNYVVARGWKSRGDKECSWEYFKDNNTSTQTIPDDTKIIVGHNIKYDLLWEMANGNEELRAFWKRGGQVWDTQYAEYLLCGQHKDAQMCSMDNIIEKYGGRKKIDEVKILWEEGYNTSEIPKDLLIDYLVGSEEEERNSGDIGNTEKIFLGQVKLAVAKGMMKTIQSRMDGLLATVEMEFNGVKVCIKTARKRLRELNKELTAVDKELNQYLTKLPNLFDFNWGSNVHASALLFGGTIRYEARGPYKDESGEWARKRVTEKWPLFDGEAQDPSQQGMYGDQDEGYCWYPRGESTPSGDPLDPVPQDTFKSGPKKGIPKFKNVSVLGEKKVKWQDQFYKLDGYVEPLPEWKTESKDGAGGPVYSTSSDTIDALEHMGDIPFLKAYTRRAFLQKEIGTYYLSVDGHGKAKGMLTCVDPKTHIIHHKLNICSTMTARLSSSDPNLQNLSRKDKSRVKEMFVSRFGEDGWNIEADYSQLEVVGQALLCHWFVPDAGDQLMKDIIAGVDFHCKRVAAWKGISYEEALARCKDEEHPLYGEWSEIRTKAKIFSFQRAYGAGDKLIALYTGMPIEDVEALSAAEDRLYPEVPAFNKAVSDEVRESAVAFKQYWPSGGFKSYRRGEVVIPTGARYTFRTYDAPAWLQKRGIKDTFSPTEMKNYPVQGTATGEIVIVMLGKLWRRFVETDNYGGKAVLVNTVHDCVWVDAHRDVVHEVAQDVQRILSSVPEVFEELHDLPVPLPFKVDVEVGRDMYDMTHYKKDEIY